MPPNSPYRSGCPHVEAAAMSLSMRSTLSSMRGACASVAAGAGVCGASACARVAFTNPRHDHSSMAANLAASVFLTTATPCVRPLGKQDSVLVAEDGAPEETLGARAGIAQALELQLEVHAVAWFELSDHVDVAPQQHAHGHAAAVVLRASEGFEQLAVHERIVIAADQAPVRVERHQRRGVDLFEQATAETVGEIDRTLGTETMLDADR